MMNCVKMKNRRTLKKIDGLGQMMIYAKLTCKWLLAIVYVMFNDWIDDNFVEDDLLMIINSLWCVYAYVWFDDVYM